MDHLPPLRPPAHLAPDVGGFWHLVLAEQESSTVPV